MRKEGLATPVIVITAFGSIESAANYEGRSNRLHGSPVDVEALELKSSRVLRGVRSGAPESFQARE